MLRRFDLSGKPVIHTQNKDTQMITAVDGRLPRYTTETSNDEVGRLDLIEILNRQEWSCSLSPKWYVAALEKAAGPVKWAEYQDNAKTAMAEKDLQADAEGRKRFEWEGSPMLVKIGQKEIFASGE